MNCLTTETVDGLINALTELGMHPEVSNYMQVDGSIFGHGDMMIHGSRDLVNRYSAVEMLADAVLIEGPDELKMAAVKELELKGYKLTKENLSCNGWRDYTIQTPKFKFRFN